MREETVKIYTFDELPEDVQRRAWEEDKTRFDSYNFCFWEFRKTLDKFAEIFEITVKWEVDSSSYTFDFCQTAATNSDDIKDPLRLATFVYNRYSRYIKKGKYYSKGGWINDEYHYKSRHSRVIFTYDDCPLTGICWDCDILRAVVDCITYRRAFDTYDDLITTALNEFFETWRAELEYAESFEFYAEVATENGTEYTERGELWRGW